MWFRFVYRDAVCSHDDPIVTIVFQGIFQRRQEVNETEVKKKKELLLFIFFTPARYCSTIHTIEPKTLWHEQALCGLKQK